MHFLCFYFSYYFKRLSISEADFQLCQKHVQINIKLQKRWLLTYASRNEFPVPIVLAEADVKIVEEGLPVLV